MGRSALILALAAAIWGCPPSTGGTVINLQPDGGPVCGEDPRLPLTYPPCDTGLRCVNRICMPNCDAGSCPGGMYCEGPAPKDVCAPVAPINCTSDVNCPNPQKCNYGLCTSLQLLADGGYAPCKLNAEPNDNCGPDALCFQNVANNGALTSNCLGQPACGQDGGCPIGSVGAICNDGRNPDGGQLFPGKQRICLFSYCMGNPDCNAAAHCFFAAPALLGQCYYGFVGDPCFTNADCPNSSGCGGSDGGLLDGGTPGTCH